jgi:hypothetical protein
MRACAFHYFGDFIDGFSLAGASTGRPNIVFFCEGRPNIVRKTRGVII